MTKNNRLYGTVNQISRFGIVAAVDQRGGSVTRTNPVSFGGSNVSSCMCGYLNTATWRHVHSK